ncbi:MAG: metalloprotease PmbA, partial [Acidiferrobacterales bacterium]|nr:metalloprotease PmbA [Acidiferrobacterales bacterium]
GWCRSTDSKNGFSDSRWGAAVSISTNDNGNIAKTEVEVDLKKVAEFALDYAKSCGMDQADVSLHQGTRVSVAARQQELEKVEKHNDAQFAVSVYKDHKTGSASSADLSESGIRSSVDAAISIANFTGSDECLGLADRELMATDLSDLDLYHPWKIDVGEMAQIALECEQAALDYDSRISNSEGATVDSYSGVAVYANSHGFISEKMSSQNSISCSVIGSEANDSPAMQRDYSYDSNRNPQKLMSAVDIGKEAANRTVKRLNSRQIASTQASVLFEPRVAKSLISHLMGAISGGAIYKKASFMLDKVNASVLPDFVTVAENPHLFGGAKSATHDSEGVATLAYRPIVESGVLQSYLLSSYTSRKLGLKTTANAGGVRNLSVSDSGHSLQQLLSDMNTGLLVTELIGSGINIVTGDYSRGATGFWVENGEIQYPVEEITIAGNLLDMYQNIVAIGNDIDRKGNTHCGSILVENLTIAGS